MRGRLKKIKFLVSILLPILLLSGCVTIYNPATQKNETLLLDTRQEVALGLELDRKIGNELKILHNPDTEYRLNKIGEKIALASDRQDIVYRFRIVKDKELNAFSIPGGFVYVNSGVLDVATDDELAGVLAHEIGHIAARHSVKKLQATLGYQIILNIALGISKSVDLKNAMEIVFNLGSLGYGRKDEFFADKLAVRYTKRAGFNPYGLITFFEKLKKEQKEKGADFNLVFLSSHPPIEERIKNIKQEIAINY
jgi:predicted Zn-dependent protease